MSQQNGQIKIMSYDDFHPRWRSHCNLMRYRNKELKSNGEINSFVNFGFVSIR